MQFTSVDDLANTLLTNFDETDTDLFSIPAARVTRVQNFIQRASDLLWSHRPWNFKFQLHPTGTNTFSFTSGFASVPDDLANIGPNGLLWNTQDSYGPWEEVDIQSMAVMRATGRYQNEQMFAVGLLSTSYAENDRLLWIPNDSAGYGAFKLLYEKSAPKITLGSAQDIRFPLAFHAVLYLGAAAKMQHAKGDPVPHWDVEYQLLLSKLEQEYYVNASKVLQMPQAVGGMW